MKRPPSAFSYVRNLEVGEAAVVDAEKSYAIRHAIAYLEAEYEQSFSVQELPDGKIQITRTI